VDSIATQIKTQMQPSIFLFEQMQQTFFLFRFQPQQRTICVFTFPVFVYIFFCLHSFIYAVFYSMG
jgi:hypothetical protein